MTSSMQTVQSQPYNCIERTVCAIPLFQPADADNYLLKSEIITSFQLLRNPRPRPFYLKDSVDLQNILAHVYQSTDRHKSSHAVVAHESAHMSKSLSQTLIAIPVEDCHLRKCTWSWTKMDCSLSSLIKFLCHSTGRLYFLAGVQLYSA